MSIFVKTVLMRLALKYISVLLSLLLLVSCGSSRKARTSSLNTGSMTATADEYLRKYGDLAVREMKRTGIPASITLAQGMLESDYGRSTLARKGNNHFGIKCHSDWKGAKIYHDDNRKGECFRAYRTVEDSYIDHSDFLVNGSRYRELFKLKSTDYKGWAHGLRKAGYATNPNYATLLIRKIEDYGLQALDAGSSRAVMAAAKESAVTKPVNDPVVNTLPEQAVAQAPVKVISLSTGRIETINNVEYIIVQQNDTYESLAEKYMLLSWEISRYNDLPAGTPLQPGQLLYLQPKRNKAATGFTTHVVQEGDTMYSVSQKYAVRLSSLFKMNLMDEGTECSVGQRLRLR